MTNMKERTNRSKIKTGQTFGRLFIVERCGTKHGYPEWLCLCSCGNTKRANSNVLINKITRSCGCLRIESTISRSRTHGMSGSPEFNIWTMLRGRCNDIKRADYPRYGGRGIKVCHSWSASFEEFIKDMGPRPSKDHSIERIDNDGDYTAQNCKWATPIEQANNRHNSVVFDYKGQKFTYRQLYQFCHPGVSLSTFRARIEHTKWDIERALNTPLRGK